jgi:hypothetical protein
VTGQPRARRATQNPSAKHTAKDAASAEYMGAGRAATEAIATKIAMMAASVGEFTVHLFNSSVYRRCISSVDTDSMF